MYVGPLGSVGLVFAESLRTRTTQGRHWAGFRLGGRALGFQALTIGLLFR